MSITQSRNAKDLSGFVRNVTAKLPSVGNPVFDPFSVFGELLPILERLEADEIKKTGKGFESGWVIPRYEFYTKTETDKNGKVKTRTIGAPNVSMKILIKLFERFIRNNLAYFVDEMTPESVVTRYQRFIHFPSAKAFVHDAQAIKNTRAHINDDYFF
jgi:hypothetical protein